MIEPHKLILTECHSPTQRRDIDKISDALMRQPSLDSRYAYVTLTELCKHTSGKFKPFCDFLDKIDPRPQAARLRTGLRAEYSKYLTIRDTAPEFLRRDEVALLTPNNLISVNPGQENTVVVFTTMFNNFYFSNFTLAALLVEAGYSAIFLNESTGHFYLNGIPGVADSWVALMRKLTETLQRIPGRVTFTGFSSGGYAALLAATHLRPDHFICFSGNVDLSESSPIRVPKLFTLEKRNQTPAELRIDLSTVIRKAGLKGCAYAGTESERDVEHMRLLSDISGVHTHLLEGEGHLSVRRLLMDGKFIDALRFGSGS